jgi:hypothetical protein
MSQLSACDVTPVVSLDTNKQAKVFKESGDMSEEAFQFLTAFCYVNSLLELIFKWVYSTDKYPFDLFRIEP